MSIEASIKNWLRDQVSDNTADLTEDQQHEIVDQLLDEYCDQIEFRVEKVAEFEEYQVHSLIDEIDGPDVEETAFAANPNVAPDNGAGITGFLHVFLIDDANLVRQQMSLLEGAECLLPFNGAQPVGEIEPERFLHTLLRSGQVLEMNVGGFLPADLPTEAVESGDEVFKRIADQMVGEFLINGLGEGKLLAR